MPTEIYLFRTFTRGIEITELMRITIETSNWNDIQRIVAMLKSLDISDFNIVSTEEKKSLISKGDKTLDPQSLFGIWKDNPRKLDEIRTKAWKRNWDI